MLALRTAAAVVLSCVVILSWQVQTHGAVHANAHVPNLDWKTCPAPSDSYECATAAVPLKHGDPGSSLISLAVIKHNATDQKHRIGAIFFNPGGPGASGLDSMDLLVANCPPELKRRFDIISFDPRGVGNSTAIRCAVTDDDWSTALDLLNQTRGFPVGPEETIAWVRANKQLGQMCADNSGELLQHVSTAATAKDLDLLRQAVGEPVLRYVGISYGTYLGAVYANLFPDKVGSMLLDANVNPAGWSGWGTQAPRLSMGLRTGGDIALRRAMQAFLKLCGMAPKGVCSFSAGSARATQAKWESLLDMVRNRSTDTSQNGTQAVPSYATIGGAVGNALYNIAGYPDLAEGLQAIWLGLTAPNTTTAANPSTTTTSIAAAANSSSADESELLEARKRAAHTRLVMAAINCGDAPNPRDPEYYATQLTAIATNRASVFGRLLTWQDEMCATWPVKAADQYLGPWNRKTANAILVVGNTYDPITPFEGSIAMATELSNTRLLGVFGYGHSVWGNPSKCASAHITKYFIDNELPPQGSTCRQDVKPFASAKR